jgi:hypothetical protein
MVGVKSWFFHLRARIFTILGNRSCSPEVAFDPNADKNFPKLCISIPRFSVISRILVYTVLSGPASSQLTAKHGGF